MMKSRNLKNALVGVALALIATYMFPVVMITIRDFPNGLLVMFSAAPRIVLMYSFWLVIPLGVGLGMLIPQMARGKSRWLAALAGAGYGAVTGFVALFCFITVMHIKTLTGVAWVSVMTYCAVWVGGYAFYCAKSQSLYR